jgi:hypothetical protein
MAFEQESSLKIRCLILISLTVCSSYYSPPAFYHRCHNQSLIILGPLTAQARTAGHPHLFKEEKGDKNKHESLKESNSDNWL